MKRTVLFALIPICVAAWTFPTYRGNYGKRCGLFTFAANQFFDHTLISGLSNPARMQFFPDGSGRLELTVYLSEI